MRCQLQSTSGLFAESVGEHISLFLLMNFLVGSVLRRRMTWPKTHRRVLATFALELRQLLVDPPPPDVLAAAWQPFVPRSSSAMR